MTDKQTFDLSEIIVEQETFERNTQRRGPADADAECHVCGRPIATIRAAWVECVNGGYDCWPQDAAPSDKEDGGYMGCYPLGPTCARKIPARFIVGYGGDRLVPATDQDPK